MEHLLRLAYSNAFLLATVLVFAFGTILWFVWARFFPERDALNRISRFVMTFAALMFFVAAYASVVVNGLDGKVCAGGRYSLHVICHRLDESPLFFWGLVVVLMGFHVAFMLAASVFLMSTAASREQRETARERNQRRSGGVAEKRPAAAGMSQAANHTFLASFGVIMISTIAWIATSLHRDKITQDLVQHQVTEALAVVARDKLAVEAYLQEHGVLPENSSALGRPSPAERRGQYVSEVAIAKGSILLTFDGATADAHLGGRELMLIAVRRGSQVSWHCISPDIDQKYLPDSCPDGLQLKHAVW